MSLLHELFLLSDHYSPLPLPALHHHRHSALVSAPSSSSSSDADTAIALMNASKEGLQALHHGTRF